MISQRLVGGKFNEMMASLPLSGEPDCGKVVFMQNTSLMDEANHNEDSRGLKQPLRVVIAYDDLAAGRRAMSVLGNVSRALGNSIRFDPIPWSFDLLADIDWRSVAADDAVKADILIIACSSSRPLPAEVGRWTKSAMDRKRGTATAVVALFGVEEAPDGSASPRLEFIKKAAEEAGLEFFAPRPGGELNEAIADIHRRAETVTPLLSGILQHHPKSDRRKTEMRT